MMQRQQPDEVQGSKIQLPDAVHSMVQHSEDVDTAVVDARAQCNG
jgi:hypothetical protein